MLLVRAGMENVVHAALDVLFIETDKGIGSDFDGGEWGEGGAGVTVVELE